LAGSREAPLRLSIDGPRVSPSVTSRSLQNLFVSRSMSLSQSEAPCPSCVRRQRLFPFVFAVGIDPVGSGLVASLAEPGGNVTGLSIQANDLAGKRLELLREVVPQLHRLAIMFNVGNAQPVLEMGETQAAARMLGLEVRPLVSPAFR
jgi:hypothetical protein